MLPSQTLDSICQDQLDDIRPAEGRLNDFMINIFEYIWRMLFSSDISVILLPLETVGLCGTDQGKASQQQLQRDQDNYHSDQDGGRSWDGSLASKPMLCVHCALQLLFFPTGGDKTSTIALQSGSKDIFCCISLILNWWRWRERANSNSDQDTSRKVKILGMYFVYVCIQEWVAWLVFAKSEEQDV